MTHKSILRALSIQHEVTTQPPWRLDCCYVAKNSMIITYYYYYCISICVPCNHFSFSGCQQWASCYMRPSLYIFLLFAASSLFLASSSRFLATSFCFLASSSCFLASYSAITLAASSLWSLKAQSFLFGRLEKQKSSLLLLLHGSKPHIICFLFSCISSFDYCLLV